MLDHPIITPKKLIEVALPLDAINAACAREKSIRQGHPSTLHLWWARRPLAAARAVIFSQLVNDPEDLWRCQNPSVEPNKQVRGHWTKTRARLFTLIEEMVLWESTINEEVLDKAREEIRKAWREVCELNKHHPQATELFDAEKMPGLHDPFAGGGTIPLEAQRLGLEAYASDLNPVAVLINKAMIEIPPKFAGRPPVNPDYKKDRKLLDREWKGAAGLAEDMRYYGRWIRDEAFKRIGHLYPKVEITDEMVADRPDLEQYRSQKLTVIAWLWARTVKSPNPAFSHIDVPLASTFVLSSKAGKEAYLEPIIEDGSYRFNVKVGKPPVDAITGTKLARGANFRCVMSHTAIEPEYIKAEGIAKRISTVLLAIVAEGVRERVYLPSLESHYKIARSADANSIAADLDTPIANDPRPMTCLLYGMTTFAELFTTRQITALSVFSELIREASKVAEENALCINGMNDGDLQSISNAAEYGNAIAVLLSCSVDKASDFWSANVTWMNDRGALQQTFGRQAIPIVWDFAEANPFSSSGGNFLHFTDRAADVLDYLPCNAPGVATQADAVTQTLSKNRVVSTDPPYYDNIGYSDLSDYFYVWLRRALRHVYPELFATLVTPKNEELVATAFRHGGKIAAGQFFLNGMTKAMCNLAALAHPAFPVSIYYAFKQSDTTDTRDTGNSGWETFLDAVVSAGFSISGTWPVRTESAGRGRARGSNALASSIVLVCRKKDVDAPTISRRQFIRELNAALPLALDAMTRESEGLHSPVAPVDLSQAIIGPGMAVFSKYSAVLEADGSPMSVHTALQLINRFLAEDDFDADTQFCLHWFDQYHWDSGKFGEADVLARAKGTSVDGVKQAGVITSAAGNVRLLKWSEYPTDWSPTTDSRLPVWETLHQLIRVFSTGGEAEAGSILAAVQSQTEAARQLAYRLYTLCERANLAEDARAYNELITSWSGIESAAAKAPAATQRTLFND